MSIAPKIQLWVPPIAVAICLSLVPSQAFAQAPHYWKVDDFAFTPDGRFLVYSITAVHVFGSHDTAIYRRELSTKRDLLYRTECDTQLEHPVLSSDGRKLAVLKRRFQSGRKSSRKHYEHLHAEYKVMNFDGSEMRTLRITYDRKKFLNSFTPDGKGLFVSDRNIILRYDLKKDRVARVFSKQNRGISIGRLKIRDGDKYYFFGFVGRGKWTQKKLSEITKITGKSARDFAYKSLIMTVDLLGDDVELHPANKAQVPARDHASSYRIFGRLLAEWGVRGLIVRPNGSLIIEPAYYVTYKPQYLYRYERGALIRFAKIRMHASGSIDLSQDSRLLAYSEWRPIPNFVVREGRRLVTYGGQGTQVGVILDRKTGSKVFLDPAAITKQVGGYRACR